MNGIRLLQSAGNAGLQEEECEILAVIKPFNSKSHWHKGRVQRPTFFSGMNGCVFSRLHVSIF